MAELLAAGTALGVASSLVNITDVAWRVLKRLKDYNDRTGDAPTIIRNISTQLPVLIDKIAELKLETDSRFISINPQTALGAAVTSCDELIQRLDVVTKKLLPKETDSRSKRIKKAFSSAYCEKELSKAWGEVESYKTLLILHFTKMKGAVEELEIPRSKKPMVPFERDPEYVGRIDIKDTQPQSDQGYIYIPVKYPSPHFTGRENYLRDLVAFFKPRSDDDIPSRRDFLLYGMGGVGKTQICLKFVEQNFSLFVRVFWVDATSKETIELSFQHIADDPVAKRDGVDGSSKSVVRWLSRINKEWLLVLDNVDGNPDVISPYLPSGRRGNILITSRNPNLSQLTRFNASKDVGEMEKDDACLMLRKVARLYNPTKEIEMQIESIVDGLHCVALAIDHAGAAIRSGICDLRDYLPMLKRHRKHLLANTLFKGASEYNQTLYSTWSLSTTVLEQKAGQNSSIMFQPEGTAIQLLHIFAFFHCNNITEETFRRAAERRQLELSSFEYSKNEELPRAIEFLPEKFLQLDPDGNWDPLIFRESIQILRSFSLVRRDKGQRAYSIHPLVHCWSRETLSQVGKIEACQLVHAILSVSIAGGQDVHDFQYCRHLLPHLSSLQQHISEANIPKKYYDDAFAKYWHVYFENGFTKEAEQFANRVKQARTNVLGEKHPSTLIATASLASTLREKGQEGTLKQAKTLHKEVLRLRIETLGEEHLETLNSKTELGSVYLHSGSPSKFKKAEGLLVQAWAGTKKHLGEDNYATLRTATLLGGAYRALALYDKAEVMQRIILDKAIEVLGKTHPETIMAMASLAATLSKITGKLNEAEEMKLEVVGLRVCVLGDDHPETLMARANLASTYCQQRRWKEAEDELIPVIQKRMVTLGEKHPEALRARLILTNCYLAQGRLDEAEAQCTQVVDGRKETISESHSDTLWSMHKLACIYRAQGRLGRAIALWGRTLAVQERALGENNEQTQECMHCLACAFYCQGRGEEAKCLMERTLRLKQKRLMEKDPKDPSILASAEALEEWRRRGERLPQANSGVNDE